MPPQRRPRAVTITDVARAAGVAPSTVSRAVTRPDRVNAVTREHVLEVANRLGYRPSPVARALGSGRTRTLALVLPDITNPYFAGVIRGAERQAAATGHVLVIGSSEESGRAEWRIVEKLAGSVDGFLIVSSRMSDQRILQTSGLRPVVLVNRQTPGVTSVSPDQESGTRQIIEHRGACRELLESPARLADGQRFQERCEHRFDEPRAMLGPVLGKVAPHLAPAVGPFVVLDADEEGGAVAHHAEGGADEILERLAEDEGLDAGEGGRARRPAGQGFISISRRTKSPRYVTSAR